MPCYHPLHGWQASYTNPETGKRPVVFKLSHAGRTPVAVSVPCGKCVGCRLERSRQWALRGVHEASLHDENSFVTLTYSDKYLPAGGTLIKKHGQDFLKRLRKRRPPRSVRFLMCGEYGDEKRRPHYHAILFGVSFPDQVPFGLSSDKTSVLYTSAELSDLWTFGHASVGAATFESIAYVARYCVKKNTPKMEFMGETRYEHIDLETGEVLPVQCEYNTMSLKPAIGKDWYMQFKSDVFPSDEAVVRGKVMKPPKYYDRLLEVEDPEALALIKADRKEQAALRAADSTKRRLLEREEIKLAQTKTLKRSIE